MASLIDLIRYEYLFRGTTVGFPGRQNLTNAPVTPTSWHPMKALYFALSCDNVFDTPAVVYVAKTSNIPATDTEYNHLHLLESEIGLTMSKIEFYSYCEGYLEIGDFKWLLERNGWPILGKVRLENLSQFCNETKPITMAEVSLLVDQMRPFLKK